MSEPIGVGDWVECIRSDGNGIVGVVAGVPYRVRAFEDGAGVCTLCGDEDGPAVSIEGVACVEWAFCLCQFRPLGGDPKSITLTRLMDVPADPEKVMA